MPLKNILKNNIHLKTVKIHHTPFKDSAITARFFIFMLVILSACSGKESSKLTIATAANMQFAMASLTEAFQQESGIESQIVLSSSGKLTAQIIAGAPYDIFVSADMRYPQTIYEQERSVKPPETYAYGKLVLWSVGDSLPGSLNNVDLRHIAIANPKTAPYGKAAMEALNHLQLADLLEEKLVYGESIAQVNQFVSSGAADVGFTAKSVVLSPTLAGKGHWREIDSAAYTPIAQGVVILNTRKDKEVAATQFRDFLFSETARQILQKFGYTAVVK